MLDLNSFAVEPESSSESVSLTLAVDVSGSMFEGGRRWIARGIVREIEQYVRLGYGKANLRLVAAGAEPREITWNLDDDVPAAILDCQGPFDMSRLLAFLKDVSGPILYVGDADWPVKATRALGAWLAMRSGDSFRAIVLGDERPKVLRGRLFAADEVFAALDGFLGNGDV